MDRPRLEAGRLLALSITGLALAAIGLAGCGGGSGGDSTTAAGSAEPSTQTVPVPAEEGEGGVRRSKDGERGESSGPPSGEKDIEEFGSEATGSESEAVVAAERGYLSAIVKGDFRSACSLVASGVRKQILELVREATGAITCPRIFPHMLASNAAKVAAQQLSGSIVKVRVEGDRGFVLFHAPGARLFVFPLLREGGRWHVATITSSILAPSAATLGEG